MQRGGNSKVDFTLHNDFKHDKSLSEFNLRALIFMKQFSFLFGSIKLCTSMWKLVLFTLLICSSNGALDDFRMPKYGSALTEAVTDIVLKFYKEISRTVNMIHASKDDQDEAREDILDEVLYLLGDEVVVQLEEFSMIRRGKGTKVHNIFFCDGYESFEKVFAKLDINIFDYQGYFLIVMSKYKDDLYETMTKVFEHLWSLQITNANILWMPAENNQETMMYTYYPYTSIYCGKAYPVQLNQYREGKWLNQPEFFPNKMTNLFGCSLRVGTFSNPPFTIVSHQNGHVKLTGVDGILLRVLSQRMNFKVEFQFDNDVQWGEIFMNGTTTGEKSCFHQNSSQFSLVFRCDSNDCAA